MRRRVLVSILFWIIIVGNTYGACNFQTNQANKGVLTVTYSGSSGKKVKLMIDKGGNKYTYNLTANGKAESFPLQMGNGEYKVTVLENTSGNSYKIVDSTKVTASMADTKSVYLASIQNIDWNSNNQAIIYADKLTQSTSDIEQKAKLLYSYMVHNYNYDYNKLSTLPTTYLPNIDSTYKTKKGICYDFSSLFAAMLRSQGIYAKLVKGYTSNATGYHAWNEVYDSKSKSWMIIDTTYDLQVIAKKKVSMQKSQSDYKKVYEY